MCIEQIMICYNQNRELENRNSKNKYPRTCVLIRTHDVSSSEIVATNKEVKKNHWPEGLCGLKGNYQNVDLGTSSNVFFWFQNCAAKQFQFESVVDSVFYVSRNWYLDTHKNAFSELLEVEMESLSCFFTTKKSSQINLLSIIWLRKIFSRINLSS